VQFRSADPDVPLAFPPEQLRKMVPLRDGGIFDVSKLREGFDALKKLYDSSGWMDFTPAPNFDIE
jgi:outer membrane protein assembly factor BamA